MAIGFVASFLDIVVAGLSYATHHKRFLTSWIDTSGSSASALLTAAPDLGAGGHRMLGTNACRGRLTIFCLVIVAVMRSSVAEATTFSTRDSLYICKCRCIESSGSNRRRHRHYRSCPLLLL